MPQVKCDNCDILHYKRPRDVQNNKSGKYFCCKNCWTAGVHVVRACLHCGEDIAVRRSRFRQKYCSKSCSNKARKGVRYDGKPKSRSYLLRKLREIVFVDRGAKCESCGYEKEPRILVLHHVKERANGGEDHPDNLKILCPNCHSLIHLS